MSESACRPVACIFDLDETLVDWSEVDFHWGESFTRAFVRQYATHPELKHHLDSIDWHALASLLLEFLSARYVDALDRESCISMDELLPLFVKIKSPFPRISKSYFVAPAYEVQLEEAFLRYSLVNQDAIFCQGLKPYEHSRALLDSLKKPGLRIGALSNAINNCRRSELEAYGLLDHFDGVFTAAAVGCPKPAREAFLRVLDRLGVPREDASRTIFIGDRLLDDGIGSLRAGMWYACVHPKGGRPHQTEALKRYDIDIESHPRFLGYFESLEKLETRIISFLKNSH